MLHLKVKIEIPLYLKESMWNGFIHSALSIYKIESSYLPYFSKAKPIVVNN